MCVIVFEDLGRRIEGRRTEVRGRGDLDMVKGDILRRGKMI